MTLSLLHRFLATSLVALTASSLHAQPIGAQDDDFLYRVVQGDTLLELSERYTLSPSHWPFLRDYNTVDDPRALPIGKILRIPFRLIPERASTASVLHVTGSAFTNDQVLSTGGSVDEGSHIQTGPAGYLTLLLEDGSTMTLPANSSAHLQRLRAFQGTGLIDAQLSIESGAVESVVAPESTGVGRFEVRTPVTITGVRGTQLRVRSTERGSHTEVLEGQAQLNASSAQAAILHGGQGALTSAEGTLHAVETLPPAPALSTPERTSQGWQLQFPPVPAADAYLVRVASDPQGTRPWSSELVRTPGPVQFSAPGAGTYYVLVRAITSSGLMGPDAAQPFEGRAILASSDGRPVASGYGGRVYLSAF